MEVLSDDELVESYRAASDCRTEEFLNQLFEVIYAGWGEAALGRVMGASAGELPSSMERQEAEKTVRQLMRETLSNHEPDVQLLSAALGPANNCPPLKDLERLLEAGAPAALEGHVDQCPHCRTELQMLRSFTSNQIAEHEKPAVNSIAAKLKTWPPINRSEGRTTVESRDTCWKRLIEVRWPAAATLAIALVVADVAIELSRGRQPAIDIVTGPTEVLRSPLAQF